MWVQDDDVPEVDGHFWVRPSDLEISKVVQQGNQSTHIVACLILSNVCTLQFRAEISCFSVRCGDSMVFYCPCPCPECFTLVLGIANLNLQLQWLTAARIWFGGTTVRPKGGIFGLRQGSSLEHHRLNSQKLQECIQSHDASDIQFWCGFDPNLAPQCQPFKAKT